MGGAEASLDDKQAIQPAHFKIPSPRPRGSRYAVRRASLDFHLGFLCPSSLIFGHSASNSEKKHVSSIELPVSSFKAVYWGDVDKGVINGDQTGHEI